MARLAHLAPRLVALAGVGLLTGCAILLSIDDDYVVGSSDGGADGGDAAGEGGNPTDAAPTGFCAKLQADASEVFCDDFADATVLGAGWSIVNNDPDAEIAFDPDAGGTDPPSLAMKTQPGAAFVSLTRIATTPAQQRIAVQATFRVDDYGDASTNETFSLLSVTLPTPGGKLTSYLYVGPQGARFYEARIPSDGGAKSQNNTDLPQFFIPNVWTRARIEVDLVAQKLTVFFDGKQLEQRALAFPWPVGEVPRITVGSEWASLVGDGGFATVGVRRFHVDDALLEVK